MATTSKPKTIDITKTGPLGGRQLQQLNSSPFTTEDPFADVRPLPISLYDINQHAQQDIPSQFAGQETQLGTSDYWGRSYFDAPTATQEQFSNLSDIRAENQPWYSKLVNGIGKAGVLAVTTALETAGLLYGALGQGVYDAVNAEDGKGGEAYLHGLWNNPITQALQKVNEVSEEYMPNYYTQDEQENPFGNIFTANFLGDKLLKNLGFMVGAFYGGIPASSLMGKAGVAAVKNARAASLAERAGMAARVSELTAKYGDDVAGLNKALAAEHLTEAERGKRILEGFDKIKNAAQTTRATTQTIGALGSAINEGAIEAINNSKDWAKQQTRVADDEYQQMLTTIEESYGGTELEAALKAQAAEEHQQKLAEIERGRARMGNADLLLNIPVLMASNMYQLGKLYTRGFDSTRRQMGSFLNGHKLSGSLEKGTLKSDKTWKGALATALAKSNTEGLEEYLQRAASDGAGQAVSDSIERFISAGTSEEATNNIGDYILGFGKAIADNLGDPNAWEEYMIGALSSMIGMPVFGSQTKNSYIAKDNGVFGFAGGIIGNYNDYMDAQKHETEIANYLNGRVNNPKFKALYSTLRKQEDYNKWLQDAIEEGDKSKYKDLELEKFFEDINAAASAGHLEEFKQLIGYNQDYTDEELEDIVKETSKKISPEEQKKWDTAARSYLEGAIAEAVDSGDNALVEEYSKELEEVNKRLEEDNYQEKLEGPFIDRNGQMNVTDPEKMREVLERNRLNILQGIDDYLKIRNDIDIETDGRLPDDKIALLTQMRGKILDYDKRSAEMANDLVNNLGDVKEYIDTWKEESDAKVKKAQEAYDRAKEHLDTVKNEKRSDKVIQEAEKQLLEAENKLKKEKYSADKNNEASQLLSWLQEEKNTTAIERVAEAKGYGNNIFGRIAAKFNRGEQRKLNADELLSILANPMNTDYLSPRVEALARLIMMTPELDNDTKSKLMKEAVDLGRLANKKLEYRNKVREFLGDPSLINEAYKQYQDKLSQKDKDNKSDELALSIKSARSMPELYNIMKDAYQINREVAKAALEKAKQTADESTKEFIADFEKGSDFYENFRDLVLKLPMPDNIRDGIIGSAIAVWDSAINSGESLYDSFLKGLKDTVVDMAKEESNPLAKSVSDGIKQVLAKLESVESSIGTNKKTNKSEKNTSEDNEDRGAVAALEALGKKRNKGKSKVDSEEDLLAAIKEEVRSSKQPDGIYRIDSQEKFSKKLTDRISAYKEANPGSEFNVDMVAILQELSNEDIASGRDNLGDEDLSEVDGSEWGELEDEEDGSSRKAEMQENVRTHYTSSHPTEYTIGNRGVYLDYRIPYEPDTEQLKAVQELLKDKKAYQFVDKNYLGYVAKALGKMPMVHLLKSTDDTINSDPDNPITFLAIEWTSEVEDAIKQHGFNGKDVLLKEEVNPITIGDTQYQLIGVLSIGTKVSEDVSKAFRSLQGALNDELNPQIASAKENGQEFIVSSKLAAKIDSIYTGRLDKTNGTHDPLNKVSLYDFMTDKQGDESRRTSTEFENGMDFYFGVIVDGFLNATEDSVIRDDFEEPNNAKWLEKNNGAILLFLPKPDGKLYPVRCTRRTVGEWLESNDLDGQHTAKELIQKVISGEIKNQYLGNIVNYLNILLDAEASLGERMQARTMLSKYFIFGKESPLHFDGGDVVLRFKGKEYDIVGEDLEESATKFFDALAKNNIKFSLPAYSIDKVNGRDVITSGVFEIGLRGFYNFNANFTLKVIDGDGNHIDVAPVSEPARPLEGGSKERGERKYDFGDGEKTFYITKDSTGTYYKVTDAEGNPVSTEIANIINMIEEISSGRVPEFKSEFWDMSGFSGNTQIKDFILNNITEFDGVYIIHASEDWIYDSRKANHSERLYRLNEGSKKDPKPGYELKQAFRQATHDFRMSPENKKAIEKLRRSSGTSSGSDTPSSLESGSPTESGTKTSTPKRPKNAETPSVNYFEGKTLDTMDIKNGGLEEWLAINKKSPMAKRIFSALQGVPTVSDKQQQDVLDTLKSDGSNADKLAKAISIINGCH